MKLLLVFLLVLSTSVSAKMLDDLAIGGGISYSFPETESSLNTDIDEDSVASFNVGILGMYRTQKGRKIRTGLMLVSKKGEFESGGSESEVEFLYLQAPLTVMRSYSKTTNFFYGINLGLKLDADCDVKNGDCDIENDAMLIHPFTIGLRYELSKELNFEASYEYSLKENSEGLNMNGLFLNVFYNL